MGGLPELRRPELSNIRVEAVLFDFDGTLTRPGELDFSVIRQEIGCPATESILSFIDAISDSRARRRAQETLLEHERRAADAAEPNDGAEEVLAALRDLGIPAAIQTRNTGESVRRAFARFTTVDESSFRMVIARDSGVAAKPDPAGIRIAAAEMGVEAGSILVVGDYLYELEAAEAIGCLSAFLRNESTTWSDERSRWAVERAEGLAAYTIDRLTEILDVIRLHRPLPQGKVPNDLLADMIHAPEHPSVIVGPAPGEDVAVVEEGTSRLLAVKSDPITFATDRPGYYTVTINANDVATSGAVPVWLTATILLPPGTLPAAVRRLISDLSEAAGAADLLLVGGHTELTDAVTRPVVAGTVVGTVSAASLLKKSDIVEGDRIILTKAAGVEGTAILAAEVQDLLLEEGLSEEMLSEARALADSLSIVPEARIAAAVPGVRCLHDVTEGGVATAIEELGIAAGRSLSIAVGGIPVLDCTRAICDVLEIDARGLIGSGGLLICVAEESAASLVSRLEQAGIRATEIGRVGSSSDSPTVVSSDGEPWPRFDTDELARFFST